MARPIEVRITGESRQAVLAIDKTERSIRGLEQTAKRAEGPLGNLGKGLKGLGTALAGAAVLNKTVDLISESVTKASNLAESQSKIGVIFGKSGKEITEWAKTTDAAMSMSQQAILDTVANFDLLLKNKGFDPQAAKQMSKELTGLSADLASFFNVDASQAASAISSALKGEMDPIEALGVTLDDATLKQRAYSMGLYKGKGPLTQIAKTQAIYAEILDQTADAQGDLLRTQGSTANQIRALKVNVDALKVTFGTAFTPLIEKYLPGINDWLKEINNEEFGKEMGQKFLDFSDKVDLAFGKVQDWLGKIDFDKAGWQDFLNYVKNDFWPDIQNIAKEFKEAFGEFDAADAKGALEGLASAAGTIGAAIETAFNAFNNLSPEAKANIALIVAAGAAFQLAQKNPIVKIGVEMTTAVLGEIGTTIAGAITSFKFPSVVAVKNFKQLPLWVTGTGGIDLPGGSGGGGGKPGKKSPLRRLGSALGNLPLIEQVIDTGAFLLAVGSIVKHYTIDKPREGRDNSLQAEKDRIKKQDEAISGISQDQIEMQKINEEAVRLEEQARKAEDSEDRKAILMAQMDNERKRQALQTKIDTADRSAHSAQEHADDAKDTANRRADINQRAAHSAQEHADEAKETARRAALAAGAARARLAAIQRRGFLYYDPHTGTYYSGGATGREAEEGTSTSSAGAPGGARRGSVFNATVINNYPSPERASDSIAMSLRVARYAVGAA